MENMDGKLDRDGQRIENRIPGNPGGMSAQEKADMERSTAYTWAANSGNLGNWYAYFDPENMPEQYQGIERSRTR